jgi:hypothetical protein
LAVSNRTANSKQPDHYDLGANEVMTRPILGDDSANLEPACWAR